MLYRTMLNNDVNEKYVNQILDEAEKVTNTGSNVDIILSNVYQKMILKLESQIALTCQERSRMLYFCRTYRSRQNNHDRQDRSKVQGGA